MSHDRITVHINETPKELFMSFGLLNELLTIVGDLPQVSLMGLQVELRNSVLYAVLSTRDGNGVIGENMGFNPFTTMVSPEDIQKIITWASEHVLGFFLKAMEANLKVHEAHKGALSSMASGNGLPLSP